MAFDRSFNHLNPRAPRFMEDRVPRGEYGGTIPGKQIVSPIF